MRGSLNRTLVLFSIIKNTVSIIVVSAKQNATKYTFLMATIKQFTLKCMIISVNSVVKQFSRMQKIIRFIERQYQIRAGELENIINFTFSTERRAI